MTGTPSINSARAALDGRIVAVVNLGSGGSDGNSPGRMGEVFNHAGLPGVEIVSVAAGELETVLDDVVPRADALVVLGGDGTIGCAAAKCGAGGKPVIALPGGTMNMLPHALYGDFSWEQALANTLADPTLHPVSSGVAEGRMFYCAAIFGSPTLWADAREALRHLDMVRATQLAVTAFRRRHARPLNYRFDHAEIASAEAIALICPLVSRRMSEDEIGLEAAVVDPHTAADLFRLAFHAVFEDWRVDPSVQMAKVKRAQITAHGRVPVILDGEKAHLGRSVSISFQPNAFTAIVPADRLNGAGS